MKLHITIIALAIAVPSLVAQEREGTPPKHKGKRPERSRAVDFLKHHDADSDGKVSPEEFAKGKRASQLDEEARKKIFVRLDKNGDGFITAKDLKSMEEDRFESFLAKCDKDGDQRISKEEFLKNPPFGEVSEERLNKMFGHMDRNSDGFLDAKDRRQGRGRMRPPGERRSPKLNLKELDQDENGSINIREFQKAEALKNVPAKERRELFLKIDLDDDKMISAEELRSYAEKRGPKKPRRSPSKK